MTTKLYRSTTDKKIFGVCGGLAQALNIDATLLRFVVVVATIFSGGTAALLYLAAAIVIPIEPGGVTPNHAYEFGFNHSNYNEQPNHKYWGSSCKSHKKATKHAMGHGMGPGAGPMNMGGSMGGPMSGTMGADAASSKQAEADNLDSLMKEVETKALRKEIEELKQRLAKFENEKGE